MSYRKNSRKGFTLVEVMIVVVIIGLLASMAIPAFNNVRAQSREKTVVNNLRQIAAAGQQYMLENGTTTVAYTSLTPTYFQTIQAVSGEAYGSLNVSDAGGTLTVTMTGGTTVTFAY